MSSRDRSRKAELCPSVAIIVDAGQASDLINWIPVACPLEPLYPGQQQRTGLVAAGNAQGAAAGSVA